MAKKFRKYRLSIIALASVVGLAVVGGAAALRLTKYPDYWLSAAGLVVAVVLPIMAHLGRDRSDSSPDRLNKIGKDLAEAVRDQWSRNVARIRRPYPLMVPFSVVTTATVDPSDLHPKSEGKGDPEGGAAAQPPPPDGPIDVMDSWASILGNPAAEPLVLDGAFTDIAKVFATDGLDKRMVILGEPGSGKSMIAQWLTVHLLQSQPEMNLAPVLLSLATWDPATLLEEWAAAEMAQTYPVLSDVVQAVGNAERTLAYQLISGKRVLMVLDGLDEMAVGNQCDALQALSEFAENGQHFVVTCRTRDYARIVHEAGVTLAKTPVIALGALEIGDVIQYLKDSNLIQGRSRNRWERVLESLVTEPDGPLAIAMTSPLVVWLVRTNYARQETRPDELFEWGNAEEITDFLLNGLVDAAYSVAVLKKNDMEMYPARKPEDRKIQRERLVYLADYLSRQLPKVDGKPGGENRLDIEWWYLPRAVPEWFTGGTVGLISGCLLGASGGLAAAIKFGHGVGVIVGIVLGIVIAVHAGTTSVRWQEVPRAVGFSAKLTFQRVASCLAVGIGVAVCFGFAAEHGGGMVVALVTAAVVGPLCAMAIKPTFGTMPAFATAVSASLALGLGASLFGHWSAPWISAGAAGLTFLVSAWVFTGVFQDTSRMKAVSPESLLRGDRNGSLIVALTAGLAFSVIFGLALGPLVGLLAFAGLGVTAAFTVSMWGAFTLTRIWLALFHKMPLGIIGFLREADTRGVLRREGGAFQFRHAKLQERLSAPATQPPLIPVAPSRTEAQLS
ncbi:MAG: NACHT domain-containing protein [Streptosporangiaceae bacterium]